LDQLNKLTCTPNLIPKVLVQMSVSAEWDVRKEATWIISNIATGGTTQHIAELVELGAIRGLCDLLDVGEVRFLLIAMEALESILKVSSKNALNYNQLVDEAEGIEKLENLQEHENHEVYQKAVSILENYFGGVEAESENIAPSINQNNSSQYQFGISQKVAQKLDSFYFDPKGEFSF